MHLRRAIAVATLALVATGCTTQPEQSLLPTAAATAPALEADRAETIAADLMSGDGTRVSGVVALPAGETMDPATAKKLLAVSGLVFETSTFAYIDATHATVDARTKSGRWRVYLVYLDGTWKVAATEEVS